MPDLAKLEHTLAVAREAKFRAERAMEAAALEYAHACEAVARAAKAVTSALRESSPNRDTEKANG